MELKGFYSNLVLWVFRGNATGEREVAFEGLKV